jgi:hypothetical protein
VLKIDAKQVIGRAIVHDRRHPEFKACGTAGNPVTPERP